MTSRYEPVSLQERVFLAFEKRGTPMHVTATCLFEPGDLARADGHLDLFRIRNHFAASLTSFRRYRQRLHRALDGSFVWVDDERFDLDYHLRYTRVAGVAASGDAALKDLCGRIMARALDRSRPLWEAWVVEGLDGGRFALVTKVHHALADGVAGVDLLAGLLAGESKAQPTWPAPVPRPSAVGLMLEEALRRAATPLASLREWVPAIAGDPWGHVKRIGDASMALWDTLGAGVRRAPACSLNRAVGPKRRFEWLTLDLRRVKEVKQRLGGTLNDVVLATTAGAMRAFLERRGAPAVDLRALVPVNVRTPSTSREPGKHGSAGLVVLPLSERDPLRCYARLCAQTEPLRLSKRALESESLTTAGMWALQIAGSLLGVLRPFNILVTNVPGPSATLDLLGCRLIEAYPQVPLFAGQALGIALFSYADKLCWGFNADYDAVPEAAQLPRLFAEAFEELSRAAELLNVARTGAREARPVAAALGSGARDPRVRDIGARADNDSITPQRVRA